MPYLTQKNICQLMIYALDQEIHPDQRQLLHLGGLVNGLGEVGVRGEEEMSLTFFQLVANFVVC